MLSNIYGYIFGAEDSNDSFTSSEFFDDNSSTNGSLVRAATTTHASVNSNNTVTSTRLKRSSAACRVATEPKVKPRSKKAGKCCNGVNNNRKCNNIE
ncbi:hypothetical protein WR25_26279 [Diploscapter pachys]|uniref:Uncharacterized protein n=1 Tax=Diploscapter pachys TaxID=2018661 RepID=A0A2A2LEG9_9BILA|nr:hypothetical protein WR25_26279 [Diploscapter pachys]